MPPKEKDGNLLWFALDGAEFFWSEVEVLRHQSPRAFPPGNLAVLSLMAQTRCQVDSISHYRELSTVAASHRSGYYQSRIDANVNLGRLSLATETRREIPHGHLHV